MSLLVQHRSIVAEPSYPYEFRILQTATMGEHVTREDLLAYPFGDDGERKAEQIDACLTRGTPQDYYSWLAVQHGKQAKFTLEKLLGLSVDKVRARYPGARFIIAMRDPRDTLLSARDFDAMRGNFGFAERPGDTDLDVIQRMGASLSILEELAQAEDCYVVRYEGLIHAKREVMRSLSSWLDIDAGDDLIAADHFHHRTSLSGQASIGRWRREMPDALANLCWEFWAGSLQRFDYAPA